MSAPTVPTDIGTEVPMGDSVAPSTPATETIPPTTPEAPGRASRWRSPGPTPRKSKPDKSPKPVRATKDSATLKKALTELYTAGGMMWAPFDPQCGMAVVNSAEPCADALVKLADENEAVKRALSALTQTSAWGGVMAAHLPIIMAIAGHHVAAVRERMPNNVVEMNSPAADTAPRPAPTTMRARGAASRSGALDVRFCPKCSGALVKGVVHTCPDGAA